MKCHYKYTIILPVLFEHLDLILNIISYDYIENTI